MQIKQQFAISSMVMSVMASAVVAFVLIFMLQQYLQDQSVHASNEFLELVSEDVKQCKDYECIDSRLKARMLYDDLELVRFEGSVKDVVYQRPFDMSNTNWLKQVVAIKVPEQKVELKNNNIQGTLTVRLSDMQALNFLQLCIIVTCIVLIPLSLFVWLLMRLFASAFIRPFYHVAGSIYQLATQKPKRFEMKNAPAEVQDLVKSINAISEKMIHQLDSLNIAKRELKWSRQIDLATGFYHTASFMQRMGALVKGDEHTSFGSVLFVRLRLQDFRHNLTHLGAFSDLRELVAGVIKTAVERDERFTAHWLGLLGGFQYGILLPHHLAQSLESFIRDLSAELTQLDERYTPLQFSNTIVCIPFKRDDELIDLLQLADDSFNKAFEKGATLPWQILSQTDVTPEITDKAYNEAYNIIAASTVRPHIIETEHGQTLGGVLVSTRPRWQDIFRRTPELACADIRKLEQLVDEHILTKVEKFGPEFPRLICPLSLGMLEIKDLIHRVLEIKSKIGNTQLCLSFPAWGLGFHAKELVQLAHQLDKNGVEFAVHSVSQSILDLKMLRQMPLKSIFLAPKLSVAVEDSPEVYCNMLAIAQYAKRIGAEVFAYKPKSEIESYVEHIGLTGLIIDKGGSKLDD